MKKLAVFIVFSFLTLTGIAQEKNPSITVTIDNIKSNEGEVLLALHNSTTFMKSDGVKSAHSKVVDGKVTVTFTDVKPGTYAILALHDLNGNKLMDFGDTGMPLESYGVSNNSAGFAPPEFSQAKFDVSDKDIEMTIRF